MVGDVYRCLNKPWGFHYYSERYKKWMWIPYLHPSNGANFVADLCPLAFFTHDMACYECTWADGTPMSNREASTLYADIIKECGDTRLKRAGFWCLSKWRWVGTFIGGGSRIKKQNGWWTVSIEAKARATKDILFAVTNRYNI